MRQFKSWGSNKSLQKKGETNMKRIALGVCLLVVLVSLGGTSFAQCTTIQNGTLVNSAGETITTGYDDWGYNYQAICLLASIAMPIKMLPGARSK
jgi:hypothetical protein